MQDHHPQQHGGASGSGPGREYSGPFGFAGDGDGTPPGPGHGDYDSMNLPTGLYGSDGRPLGSPDNDHHSAWPQFGVWMSVSAMVLMLGGAVVLFVLLQGSGDESVRTQASHTSTPTSTSSSSVSAIPPATSIPTAAPLVRAGDRKRLTSSVMQYVEDARAGRCRLTWERTPELERSAAFNSRTVFCDKVLPRFQDFKSTPACTFSNAGTPSARCSFGTNALVVASFDLEGSSVMIDYFLTPQEF